MEVFYILRDKIPLRVWRKKDEDEIICQNMYRFISQNITMTEEIRFADLYLYSKKIDAVIVGSDQVWRYKYVANIEEYFLKSFVSGDLKRIAYAASFGVDKWEFPLRQTRRCAKLAHTFQAISVRESNGVEFCKQYMGVKAVHLLDPTMLLKQSAYISLVEKDKVPESKGNLLVYILDQSKDKEKILDFMKSRMDLIPFTVMPAKRFENVGSKQLDQCVYPSVTTWLRGFMDAKYVVTDSFHGTVFSIIFNKPFIAIGNKQRGLMRFVSLLKTFGLEERLIYSSDQLTEELLKSPINFEEINRIHDSERFRAMNFLHKVLD
ncbi:polysaccharide pyruvyl transferase family protein [Bacteroides cellulosilyticus]|uniref:polysaccharide pyruvyl transferase family protein n=1 Tax=Bacteroides cellulosilyticus TaxID=246787 RepID=UPI0032EBF921